MPNFDYPDNAPVVDPDRTVSVAWRQWFQRAQLALESIFGSGTTATRPTRMLWIGRQHFDTTLGKPIWIKSVGPAVWVDATGTSV